MHRRSRAPRRRAIRRSSDWRARVWQSPSCTAATLSPGCCKARKQRRPSVVRTALLSALAGLVIAADWFRLEDPQRDTRRAAALVAIAIAPALVRAVWFRLAAVACAALAGVAISFSVSPVGGGWFFAPIADRFGSGFVDFYAYRLPVDPFIHPRMHMLILLAVFVFTLLAAQAIAARRPVLAVAIFLVGAGWPSTLLAGGHELWRGAVILTCALALLAGVRERVSRFALPAVAVVLVAALAL